MYNYPFFCILNYVSRYPLFENTFKFLPGGSVKATGGLFFVVFLALSWPARAAEGEQTLVLGLDEAVERALAQNLDLKKDRIDLSTAEYSADHLWSLLFPRISLSGSFGYGTGLFSDYDPGGSNPSYEAAAGIVFSLNAGIPLRMKIIKLAFESRLLDYEDARRRLEIDVAKEFFALIAEREKLSNLRDMLELAERQLERDRVAFNNGVKGELAFLQSRLGAETARYNFSNARTDFDNRMGDFMVLLGLDHDTRAVLEGEISVAAFDADGEALIREHLPGRPDIVSQRRDIENFEYVKKRSALESRAPSIGLSARWNTSQFDPFADRVTGSVSVTIPVDPWIPGTQDAQTLRSAEKDVEKARLDLQSTEQAAAAQIRSLTARLKSSWTSVEIARLSVDIARRTYELNEQGFLLGTVESLDLEESRNSLSGKRQALLESELSYQTMILDLAAALNMDWKDFAGSMP
jgi:outer membrane protein TolC